VLESGNLLIVLRSWKSWFAGKSLWHPYQYIEQSFFHARRGYDSENHTLCTIKSISTRYLR
jgi:hypothetical protein